MNYCYEFVFYTQKLMEIEKIIISNLYWRNFVIFYSLIFTILPIILNLSAAFYIISKENSENPEFYKYFLKNPKVVSICSVVSGADIEVLQILSSKFAGFDIFTAPFSQKAEKYIFWYALVGFCFEDIPQFTIQVINNITLYTLLFYN